MFTSKLIASTAVAVVIAATSVLAAEMDFVSDRAMCDLDDSSRLELGMTMRADGVFTIEYGCFYEPLDPIDWSTTQTQVKVGYCNEPGLIFPGVYVFLTSQYEPGVMNFYEGDSGERQVYYDCNYKP